MFLSSVLRGSSWALTDIKSKFRRSILGPVWETINISVLIAGMSIVSSALFNIDVISILPYLAFGIITWSLISNSIIEGCNCFIQNANLIKASNYNFGLYVGRLVFRVYFTGLLHMSIFFVGVLFSVVSLNINNLMAFLGLLILFMNYLHLRENRSVRIINLQLQSSGKPSTRFSPRKLVQLAFLTLYFQ